MIVEIFAVHLQDMIYSMNFIKMQRFIVYGLDGCLKIPSIWWKNMSQKIIKLLKNIYTKVATLIKFLKRRRVNMSMEGCDYCDGCDVCQLCDDGCQPGCDTCQGFCESD